MESKGNGKENGVERKGEGKGKGKDRKGMERAKGCPGLCTCYVNDIDFALGPNIS